MHARRMPALLMHLFVSVSWFGFGIQTATAQVPTNITNGNFATGDFTGYTRTAFYGPAPVTGGPNFATFLAAQAAGAAKRDSNGVVAAQKGAFDGFGEDTAPIPPLHGSFLAYLSNESPVGNVTLTGSSISQTFIVPVGATSLTFDARFISNEINDDFSTYNDFGGVAITRGSTILAQYNFDLAGLANTKVIPDTHVGSFYASSPWVTPSLSLAGLAGQTVTVTAYVTNYRDSSVESRLLVGNFQIQITNQCVTNYQLVSESNNAQAQQTYVFKADFVNRGPALQVVTATVSTTPDPFGLRLYPQQDTLIFGPPVPANSQVTSNNTFTLIANRGTTLNLDGLTWVCSTAPNQPVAIAGPNRIVQVGTVVNLDGSGSTTPAGAPPLTYQWRIISRPPGTATKLFFDTTVNPTFVADVAGTYVIELTVSNGRASSTSTITITAQ